MISEAKTVSSGDSKMLLYFLPTVVFGILINANNFWPFNYTGILHIDFYCNIG